VIVRTVRGDVAPEALGATDAHEHFFLDTPIQPGDGFLDPERAVEEAQALAAAGAAAVVDWTPLGLGRDVAGLVAVSERTGLHVVAATGLHRDAHYPAGSPWRALDGDALAARFTAEVTSGMDDGAVRAGLIKTGCSYHVIKPLEAVVLEAAAAAHAATGAPIGVHTEHGTHGRAVVERLAGLGVAPGSVILAHVDRNPDPEEHAETAALGAWLQLDGPGRTKYWPDSAILGLIDALAARGHAGRLLLGGDTGRRSSFRAYGGGPGMDYVFARFKPRLPAELAEQIFVANPARAFAFAPREERGR
jgi:5-phospho-D-xylono-1,4-lactonase